VTSPQASSSDPLVTVVLIGGTDTETRAIVEQVLASISIPSVIEGSAVYGVQVHSQHRERAREALRAEPRLVGHWMEYVDAPAQ
jgi:3'-phosphoadenosine 5'-phosphosulfate sulfotransferase